MRLRVETRHHRKMRGQGVHLLRVGVDEQRPLRREPIQVGGRIPLVPIGTGMLRAQGVNADKDDVPDVR